MLGPAHPIGGLRAHPLTTRRFDYCGPQRSRGGTDSGGGGGVTGRQPSGHCWTDGSEPCGFAHEYHAYCGGTGSDSDGSPETAARDAPTIDGSAYGQEGPQAGPSPSRTGEPPTP